MAPSAVETTTAVAKDTAVDTADGTANSANGLGVKTKPIVAQWLKHVRGGFAPFPVALDKAEGSIVTDVDGRTYIDFITQFAVMNFGHNHPKILKAAIDQMQRLPLVNTSYINPKYAELAERITTKYGYDSVTAMCTGAEIVDSAIKVARKWAYIKKGTPVDKAHILTTDKCYHGITLATMPLSNVILDNFGQHLPNVGPYAPKTGKLVEYGDIESLKEAFEGDADTIAAFLIEPVQGAAGTRVPPEGYLKAVQDLCHKHNILFICDEVQSGFGRTGTDFAYMHEPGVQPDLVTMGKALTGGLYPMSFLMGKKEVMDVIDKFEIGSTYGASTVACAAGLAVMDIMEEEQISARSKRMGELLTKALDDAKLPYLLEHRGRNRGLFQTLVVDESVPGVKGRKIVALCALRGLLCGSSANRLRFSPALTISEAELLKGVSIIASAFRDVATLNDDIPGATTIN